MRVGKNIEHMKAASVLIKSQNKSDPIIKALAVGRQLGYAGYLTYDIANWVSPQYSRTLMTGTRHKVHHVERQQGHQPDCSQVLVHWIDMQHHCWCVQDLRESKCIEASLCV